MNEDMLESPEESRGNSQAETAAASRPMMDAQEAPSVPRDEAALLSVGRHLISSPSPRSYQTWYLVFSELVRRRQPSEKATRALFILGWIGTDEALALLRAAVLSPQPSVRADAAFALAQVASDETCIALCELLADRDVRVAGTVADALGWHGGDFLVPAIRQAAIKAPSNARRFALQTLAMIGTNAAREAAEEIRRGVEE